MNVEKKAVSADLRTQLKTANEAYTSCISTEFLTQFLNGKKVSIEDFCVNERKSMQDLDT
jgi:hypothetical protein